MAPDTGADPLMRVFPDRKKEWDVLPKLKIVKIMKI